MITCLAPPHRFDLLPAAAYAQLLGLYLGDGCIAPLRQTFQLRIAMDAQHAGTITEAIAAVRLIAPLNAVGAYPVRGERCVNVTSCNPSWPCLLPQHGPGKKHLRPIRLEPWQVSSSRPSQVAFFAASSTPTDGEARTASA